MSGMRTAVPEALLAAVADELDVPVGGGALSPVLPRISEQKILPLAWA